MKRAYQAIVSLMLLIVAACSASGASAAPHIQPRLLVESAAMPGTVVMLAIEMRAEPGWHGYWSNPGDAGLGMEVDWQLPTGARAEGLRYPVPDTLLVVGMMNHVYKGDYALLVPLHVPAKAKAGERLTITGNARWLACTDTLCVPEQARLATEVVVGTPSINPRFDQWRMKLPAPLGAEARFAVEERRIRIAIPLPNTVALTDPHLFVTEDKVIDYAAVQTFSMEPDMLVIEVPRARFGAVAPNRLSGVLRMAAGQPDGLSFSAMPGRVPPSGLPMRAAERSSLPSLPLLLLAAIAGGLLLNIMPCVFPILSLKALSLARAGGNEADAKRDGLAYSGGVIVACLLLGAVLLFLRAGGSQIGWAFQLQEPLVIAALLLLAVAITANLLGLYEFSVPGFAGAGNRKGAFATGLLAAFVATPCTGPFMAAAMGAALLLPVVPAMALFAALGLGIALPFLAIAFVPAVRRMLPKPGQWMVLFRRWMALPMALTALALLWLATRVGGTIFALVTAIGALLLLGHLFIIGRRQRKGEASGRFVMVQIVALLVFGAIVLPQTIRTAAHADGGILPVHAFSEGALQQARASGKPVFVWMTADWCITCKVNEKVAIERTDVRDAFAKAGVVVLRGDWTRRDPAITRYLTAQGAAGVPLYMWYPGNRAAAGALPSVLPQVLSPGALIELARNASPQ